ncbi:hypothetical protein AMTRI_Chr05g68960 [Amborella trichopoda]
MVLLFVILNAPYPGFAMPLHAMFPLYAPSLSSLCTEPVLLSATLYLSLFNIALSLSVQFVFSGKVHGSLARAGKVRGQTPKVAKQDKKKKPRGRAHKRMQYNRRFVTAVVGFGKKRGPNSSEK